MRLRSPCGRLQLKNDSDAKMKALYLAEASKRDDHEVECTRLRAEFEDDRHDFRTRSGTLAYEDMKRIMEHLDWVLPALPYQVRKCTNNIVADPVIPKPITSDA
ncbi:hypothetical protein, unknown function [Leishmania tarentolae]|uniref:Uncharacterized protein n=1 Tax=Leishmania tarentolae TaxID=5689 RepID=A0A640KHC8_LEITA|nr:hypothetical protein, unknown function [Leishmania tarentolae]